MQNTISNNSCQAFDSIRQFDATNNEYWSARTLAKTLTYSDWRNFEKVLDRAYKAIKTNTEYPTEHIGGVTESLSDGRKVSDFKLSRYACYMIALEADGRKKIVAQAKHYFATQTRKAEIAQEAPKQTYNLDLLQGMLDYMKAQEKRVNQLELRVQEVEKIEPVQVTSYKGARTLEKARKAEIGLEINTLIKAQFYKEGDDYREVFTRAYDTYSREMGKTYSGAKTASLESKKELLGWLKNRNQLIAA